MRPRILRTLFLLVALLIVLITVFLARFSLTAVEEPGRLETSLADWSKHFLIRRASRKGISAPPKGKKASIAEGDMLYGIDCSMCHGRDGHGRTDVGRWMYPRAADLTSPEVQTYSDRDLFWILKNGIRFSGMPAFGKVETDEHIWNLVDYLRTISQQSQRKSSEIIRWRRTFQQSAPGRQSCERTAVSVPITARGLHWRTAER
jgi:mono/diheme cytochrome c family protein